MRRSLRFTLLATLGSGCVLAQETSTTLWNEYTANPDNHGHIPNCSFAGYRHGEAAPPHVPVVANALDFGAVADGNAATPTDNYAAFRKAIEVAQARGGGAVLIPAGTYWVNNLIRIRYSGVVLRGAGQGQTVLKFGRTLTQLFGANNLGSSSRWNWSGGLIWMAPDTNHTTNSTWNWSFVANTPGGYTSSGPGHSWEYFHHGAELTQVNLTELTEIPRGGRVLPVADASKLKAGEYYLLTYENTADNSLLREIGEHPLLATASAASFGSWMTDLASYPRWRWPVQIASVDTANNTVTLKQPLRVAAKAQWNCRFWAIGKHVRESGVEDLTISLPGTPGLGHNAGFGWNGIYVSKALNCWIRNVTVQNSENGIILTGCKGVSLLNTSVTGAQPIHHAYAARCEVQDSIFDGFVMQQTGDPGPLHGINTEWLAAGNVWTRGNMNVGTFDSHRAMSFDYIRTGITMRNTDNPGGASQAGFFTGRRVAHWNINIQDCPRPEAEKGIYVYQQNQFVRSVLCGIQGASNYTGAPYAMPVGDKDVRLADDGIIPTTASNLYDSQLQLRKDQEGLAALAWPNNEIHAPGNITLVAAAAAKTGRTVTSVEYLANDVVVATANAAPWSAVWTGAAAGFYQIKVRVNDSTSESLLSPPAPLTVGWRVRIEENHPGWTYSGNWITQPGAAYSNGLMRRNGSGSGQSASFSFTGTRVRIVTTSWNGNQSNQLFLDDLVNPLLTLPGLQDVFYDHEHWNSGLLPNGAHTIRIARTGEAINIDYIEIDSTVPINAQPEARIQAAPATSGYAPLSVNFASTGSADPDGTIVSYAWDFNNDGNTDSTDASGFFAYSTPGTYTCKLTVTDNAGLAGQAAVVITATNPLPTPVITTTPSPAGGDAPLLVTFDGSSSSSPLPSRTITLWEWDFTNDGTYDATGATSSFSYTGAGTFTAKLRVTDSSSLTNTTTVTVTAVGNMAPVVNAGADSGVGGPVLPLVHPLSASAADDGKPVGSTLTYAWTQLSGPLSATISNTAILNPSVSFPIDGTYVLQLAVSDGLLTTTDSVQFIVEQNLDTPFLESGGLLCLEAENFTGSGTPAGEPAGTGMAWIMANTLADASGGKYIANNIESANSGTWSSGCYVEFDVKFSTAGTYYYFVRRYAATQGDNSGFWGFAGDAANSGNHDNDSVGLNSWRWWPGGTVTVSAGQIGSVRKLRLVRREAGYQIDKVVLSTTSTAPTGQGPAESAREASGSPYNTWMTSYPGIPVLDRDPLDDPDGDSLANLLEYHTGTEPNAGNDSPLKAVATTASAITLEWKRRKGMTGVIEQLRFSPDLTIPFAPLDLAHAATYQFISDDGTFETVRASVTRPLGEASLFLRLRVSQ